MFLYKNKKQKKKTRLIGNRLRGVSEGRELGDWVEKVKGLSKQTGSYRIVIGM